MTYAPKWLPIAAVLSVVAGGVRADRPSVQMGLDRLERVREALRERLRTRAAADAAVEAPRDLRLEFDESLGRAGMRIDLRRQGGRWFVRGLDAGRGAPEAVDANATALTWEGDRIEGVLSLAWDNKDTEERMTQQFRLKLRAAPTELRLALTLHRFQGARGWVLAYKPEGKAWTLDRELETPRQLIHWGPFRRTFSKLRPDAAGRFDGRIEMTYSGDQERAAEAYKDNQPVVTFSARLVDGRINANWLLKAPGGKHMLGSGQDMLTGVERTAEGTGSYRSEGPKGRWMGRVRGEVMPAPSDPVAAVAADDGAPGSADADATTRAAALYREICALDMALRHYPMPLTDALSRTLAPKPTWPADADASAMKAYVDALVAQAQRAGSPPPDVPTGAVAPEDKAFGPYFGRECLAPPVSPNRIAAVGDGPQQWRSLTGWKMVGPFAVYDQQADVRFPELPAVRDAAFRRTRVFTTPEGEAQTVRDAVAWMDAEIDGATVAAPRKPEASSGSLRALTWYATTDLTSEVEQTVWLAVGLESQGMVWRNEEMVWRSGRDFESLSPAVFQVRLRRGVNCLLVRCASNGASNAHFNRIDWLEGHAGRPAGRVEFTTFALHVCTQGAPGGAAGMSLAVPAPPDGPLGRRRDGTGVYPQADPPLAWDLERGINVAWKTPLAHGTAEPVARDGRLYVTAEPGSLICLDAATGKILWQREVADPPSPGGDDHRRPTSTATASPVVAADRVYVHFGCGKAACFDRDGEKLWEKPAGGPWSHPNMGSPLLADGKLIVQTLTHAKRRKAVFGVMALDANTGELLWTASGPPKRTITPHDRAEGVGNGLALMRLANGARRRTLTITGDGVVLDLATGEMLHRDIFRTEAPRAAPYVDGDTVYIAPVAGEEAVKLWLDDQGRVGARTLWKNPPRWGRGQVKTAVAWGESHWMKGPVLHDGLLYVARVDSAHVPQHYVCAWTQLETFDVRTGSRVARIRANLCDATDPTVAPAIAGRYLYVADGGAPVGGFGGTTTHGQMAVLEIMAVDPARRTDVAMHTPTHNGAWGLAALVSRNKIGRTRCAPVFEGNRMFLRSFDAVTCVATTGDEGRRYEQRQMAKNTVEELLRQKPRPPAVLEPTGQDEAPTADVPMVRVAPGASADDWLVLGPLSLDAGRDVLEELGGPEAARPREGTEIAVRGKQVSFRRVKPEHFGAPGQLDIVAALDGNRNCQGYLYAVLECGRAQELRYVPSPVVAGTWLGGVRLQKDSVVRLDVGYYPILLHVRVNRVPAFVKPKVTLGFQRPPPAFDTPELWTARVRRLEGRLREICQELGGTGYARTARLALAGAGLPVPSTPEGSARARPTSPAPAGPSPAPARPAATDGVDNTRMFFAAVGAVAVLAALVVVVRRRKSAGRA